MDDRKWGNDGGNRRHITHERNDLWISEFVMMGRITDTYSMIMLKIETADDNDTFMLNPEMAQLKLETDETR